MWDERYAGAGSKVVAALKSGGLLMLLNFEHTAELVPDVVEGRGHVGRSVVVHVLARRVR